MNYLKALLVGSACCLLQYGAMAQNCNYVKNETDKFTKQKSQLTEVMRVVTKNIKVKRVYTIEKIDMQAKAENGQRMLVLTYYFALGSTVANTNSKAIVLTADGTTLELPCLQNMPDQMQKRSGVAVLSYAFGIDDAAFEKLCASNITDVRVTSIINPVDFTVMEGVNTNSLFQCIR